MFEEISIYEVIENIFFRIFLQNLHDKPFNVDSEHQFMFCHVSFLFCSNTIYIITFSIYE